MALPLMTTDVANHSKLDDFPSNDFGSSALLRTYFDKAAVDIKAFINSVLIPAIEVYAGTGLLVGGAYVAETTYAANTIITYDGSAYITIQSVTGVTPTDDGVYYRLLVEKGDSPVGYSYEDLSDVPTTFTPDSHTHGNVTNDGKIGSTADLPVFTTTAGAVTTKTIAAAKTLLGVPASVPKIISGSYTGNATSPRTIDLGVATSAVFIRQRNAYYTASYDNETVGNSASASFSTSDTGGASTDSNGFGLVVCAANGFTLTGGSTSKYLNRNSTTYEYLAFVAGG